MARSREPVQKRRSGLEALAKELSLLRDGVRSMGDTVRSLEKKVFVLEFSSPKTHDRETVKAELRLIRSDLASIEKKLPTAAETASTV